MRKRKHTRRKIFGEKLEEGKSEKRESEKKEEQKTLSPDSPKGKKEGTWKDRLRPRKKKAMAAKLGGCPLEEPSQRGEVPSSSEPPPKTLAEARKGLFWEGFEKAIHSEIKQLEKMGVCRHQGNT